jgi:hypothetical protein
VSGFTEILLITVIVLGIVFLPRLAGRRGNTEESMTPSGARISFKMRIAILASLVWPSAMAFLLKPWDKSLIPFLYIGIAPVIISWGIGWIVEGYRRGHK